MSQWEKLMLEIMRKDPGLRFEDLRKALEKVGYTSRQPKSGSSHCTFRKAGCMPITIPMHYPMNKAYLAMVADAVRTYMEESDDE
ncbi:MAG: toxin HicA [Oscillospiraceae bacterium]|nr:toxin HicA [Oscillospiraceae bacterium]